MSAEPAGPEVTLTFDNGPEPEATPVVLDALRRHGLRATFFVVGRKLEELLLQHGQENGEHRLPGGRRVERLRAWVLEGVEQELEHARLGFPDPGPAGEELFEGCLLQKLALKIVEVGEPELHRSSISITLPSSSGSTGPSRGAPVTRRRIRCGLAFRIGTIGRATARGEDEDRSDGCQAREAHSQYDDVGASSDGRTV